MCSNTSDHATTPSTLSPCVPALFSDFKLNGPHQGIPWWWQVCDIAQLTSLHKSNTSERDTLCTGCPQCFMLIHHPGPDGNPFRESHAAIAWAERANPKRGHSKIGDLSNVCFDAEESLRVTWLETSPLPLAVSLAPGYVQPHPTKRSRRLHNSPRKVAGDNSTGGRSNQVSNRMQLGVARPNTACEPRRTHRRRPDHRHTLASRRRRLACDVLRALLPVECAMLSR